MSEKEQKLDKKATPADQLTEDEQDSPKVLVIGKYLEEQKGMRKILAEIEARRAKGDEIGGKSIDEERQETLSEEKRMLEKLLAGIKKGEIVSAYSVEDKKSKK